MKTQSKLSNPRDIRRRLGLNQQEFWGMIGVTQSGGSRYESGRSMPKPVQQLLRLVHVDRIDISRLTGHRRGTACGAGRYRRYPSQWCRGPRRLRRRRTSVRLERVTTAASAAVFISARRCRSLSHARNAGIAERAPKRRNPTPFSA